MNLTTARRSSAGDIRSEAWKSDINIPGTGNFRHGTDTLLSNA